MFVDWLIRLMSKTPRPTDAELAILRVLWQLGPSTVRQVHDVLMRDRPTAYTTALKLLQIMTEKGLVRRDESDRTHIYQSRLTEEQTQRQLIRDLMDRAFGGSSSKLVMQALASKRAIDRRARRNSPHARAGEIERRSGDEITGRFVMTAIEHLIQQPAAQAIGWALLQFVWQGALVGLLFAAALFALRRSAADVRYVVAAIGLSLMLTMPDGDGASDVASDDRWRTHGQHAISLECATSAKRRHPAIGAWRQLRNRPPAR